MTIDREALRAASPPPLERQLDALRDAAAGISAACAQLAREPSVSNADALLSRLAGSTQGVRHLRRRLQAEESRP